MAALLDRYRSGERERVWHELQKLGARVREDRCRADAEAVVCEAMERARQNVVALVDRLAAMGYAFAAQTPLAPPDAHTPGFVAWLEQQWGPLPLVARAWIEVVGDVDLRGRHPAFADDAVTDPLVVEFEHKLRGADRDAARTFFRAEHAAWQDGADEVGLFSLDFAPDALHKADISGGAPYGILVPDACADATMRFDGGVRISFVEYLRLTFRGGGFARSFAAGLPATRRLAEGLLDL